MLSKFVETLRRADRHVATAFALALVFGAVAGAVVPHTNKDPVAAFLAHPPLPLQMEAAAPVTTITNPESLIVRAETVDMSPLLQQVAMQKMIAEQRCLAEAMYYEARGEGVAGEKAIAEVVFHRTKAPGYPHSLCGVVYQGAGSGHGCQFSFACDGQMALAKNGGAWAQAKRLAREILSGVVELGDATGDAISFHAVDVEPGWGEHLIKTIQIGNHVFYRSAFHTRSS